MINSTPRHVGVTFGVAWALCGVSVAGAAYQVADILEAVRLLHQLEFPLDVSREEIQDLDALVQEEMDLHDPDTFVFLPFLLKKHDKGLARSLSRFWAQSARVHYRLIPDLAKAWVREDHDGVRESIGQILQAVLAETWNHPNREEIILPSLQSIVVSQRPHDERRLFLGQLINEWPRPDDDLRRWLIEVMEGDDKGNAEFCVPIAHALGRTDGSEVGTVLARLALETTDMECKVAATIALRRHSEVAKWKQDAISVFEEAARVVPAAASELVMPLVQTAPSPYVLELLANTLQTRDPTLRGWVIRGLESVTGLNGGDLGYETIAGHPVFDPEFTDSAREAKIAAQIDACKRWIEWWNEGEGRSNPLTIPAACR